MEISGEFLIKINFFETDLKCLNSQNYRVWWKLKWLNPFLSRIVRDFRFFRLAFGGGRGWGSSILSVAINLCSQEEWAFSSFHFYAYHSLRSYTQIIKWSKIASNNTTKSLIGHFFDDFHRVLVEREGFWVQFVRKKDILQVFLLMSLKKHVQVSSEVGFEVPQYISHVHRVVTSYCIQLSLSNISPLGGTYWITKTMSQSMYFYLFHANFQFSVGN